MIQSVMSWTSDIIHPRHKHINWIGQGGRWLASCSTDPPIWKSCQVGNLSYNFASYPLHRVLIQNHDIQKEHLITQGLKCVIKRNIENITSEGRYLLLSDLGGNIDVKLM